VLTQVTEARRNYSTLFLASAHDEGSSRHRKPGAGHRVFEAFHTNHLSFSMKAHRHTCPADSRKEDLESNLGLQGRRGCSQDECAMTADDARKAYLFMPRMPRVPPPKDNGNFQPVAIVFSILLVDTSGCLHVFETPRRSYSLAFGKTSIEPT